MHHVAHDGTRPDDRHLHDQIVETFGPQPRQGRHLRTRLHLEHAHGVGPLQQAIHIGIVRRQVGEIDARLPRA
jgi:hypothetical protein